MIPRILDQDVIIDGVDVDHITNRPSEVEHVAIHKNDDAELRAVPFRKVEAGYDEVDVDLMQFDEVCEYVQEQTDYDRPINFARVPAWPPDTRQ